MGMGAPIDADSGLRGLIALLVHKGTINNSEGDEIIQYAELEYAKLPAHKKPPEFPSDVK